MRFKNAVEATDDIRDCYEKGMRALGSNSSKVKPENNRSLNGSVNLDGCVSGEYPASPRWDYIIGYKDAAYFVEVHPASTSNVNEMIAKLNWLKSWLKREGTEINTIKATNMPFRWVASKGVGIVKDSPQALRLAKSGLPFPQKITVLK
jgi:hypothetical protein